MARRSQSIMVTRRASLAIKCVAMMWFIIVYFVSLSLPLTHVYGEAYLKACPLMFPHQFVCCILRLQHGASAIP
jgi:hypothetical protein